MVIVRLNGGLGNQLFQYAAGRAIAYRNKVPLKLDTSQIANYPLRKYSLDNFNIAASLAEPFEVAHLTGSDRNRIHRRASHLIQQSLPYYRRSVFREPHFHFDPNITKASRQVYLVGYWQSERYFREIDAILRRELTVKSAPDPVNEAMACQIDQTESVSLHIRRGDYVSDPDISRYHGSCSLEYYQIAIQHIAQILEQPHFFVFSDDMEWARVNLLVDFPLTYVAHNGPDKDYEDLRLMSLCKHHILANSTFSWWGAWLCENGAKTVIAPRKWFNGAARDTCDLIPSSWIQL